jgi:polar amino acid transport system substrate-binding protein
MKSLFVLWAVSLTGVLWAGAAPPNVTGQTNPKVLRVGVAGSEPFVIKREASLDGISVEIWRAVADEAGWHYHFQTYENVPIALNALSSGALDVVVGPVSITAERAGLFRFSQPYYESSLSILSRSEELSPWQRVKPFFNASFYYAVGFLLLVLTIVGALVWLAERRRPETQFNDRALQGIGNGIWLAVVTMSTVGYGDITPKTRLGRAVTGIWIIFSVITASSLVAGIASTLTLSGLRTSVVSTAAQLNGRIVAVLADSPGEDFARRHEARVREVETLQQGYQLLSGRQVDSVVFDRPQLLYYLQRQPDAQMAVSSAEYMHQNYGFAMSNASADLAHTMNVHLLALEESGRVARIVRNWLGESKE